MNSVWACFLIGLLTGAAISGFLVFELEKLAKIDAIAAQKSADITSCNQDKAITQKSEADYEEKVSDLNKRLSTLMLLPAHCVPIIASDTSTTSTKVKHRPAKRNAGITSTALYKYAGECKSDQDELNSLIDIVNAIVARKPLN